MTWQHQPGSQVPWQPGPPFPSQPGAFPGGYPGQAFPGQAAPSIPPKILQAAEAAGLGTPTRAYTKSAGKRLVGAGTLITLIVSVVILSAGILVPLLLLPTDPLEIIIILGTLLIVVLALLPFVGVFKGLLGIGRGGGSLRFWSCPHGLVYMLGHRISTLRWEQLGLVYRKTAIVNGQVGIIGYFVQPTGAPAFQFSVLGGALGNMANMVLEDPGLSIKTGAGAVSNDGGVASIWGAVDASAYVGLGTLIEEQLLAHQLPLVREAYQRGQTVAFGRLLLHQRGLSDGVHVVTWEEYSHSLTEDGGSIQVFKKPGGLPGFQVSGLPNMAVLLALFEEIRGAGKRIG